MMNPACFITGLVPLIPGHRPFIDQLGLQAITLVVHDFGGPIGLSGRAVASIPGRAPKPQARVASSSGNPVDLGV